MEKARKKEHNNKEIRGMTAVNMFLQLHVIIAAGLYPYPGLALTKI